MDGKDTMSDKPQEKSTETGASSVRRGGRSKLWILLLLIPAALLLAVAGPFLAGGKKKSPSRQTATVSHAAAARGLVEGGEEVTIASRIGGRISRILVDEGDKVSRNQIIVQLDDAEEQAMRAQASASLARHSARLRELQSGYRMEDVEAAEHAYSRTVAIFNHAQDEHERYKRLYAKDAVTLVELNRTEERRRVAEQSMREARQTAQKLRKGERAEQVQQGRAMAEEARASVELAVARLNNHRILSPMDGLVADRLREPGESIEAGTPVLVLISPEKMRIRAELEESDVGKVSVGQKVTVTSDTHPGKSFSGRVTKVAPVVRKKTQKNFDPMVSFDINTQKITIHLDDWRGLYHGMTVMVRFE